MNRLQLKVNFNWLRENDDVWASSLLPFLSSISIRTHVLQHLFLRDLVVFICVEENKYPISNITVYFQIRVSCRHSESVTHKLIRFISFNKTVVIQIMLLPRLINIFFKICSNDDLIIIFEIKFHLLLQFLFKLLTSEKLLLWLLSNNALDYQWILSYILVIYFL